MTVSARSERQRARGLLAVCGMTVGARSGGPRGPQLARGTWHDGEREEWASAEDDRAVAVEQYPVFAVPPDRACEHLRLDIPAGRRQLVRVEGMVDPGHVLLDDGALV